MRRPLRGCLRGCRSNPKVVARCATWEIRRVSAPASPVRLGCSYARGGRQPQSTDSMGCPSSLGVHAAFRSCMVSLTRASITYPSTTSTAAVPGLHVISELTESRNATAHVLLAGVYAERDSISPMCRSPMTATSPTPRPRISRTTLLACARVANGGKKHSVPGCHLMPATVHVHDFRAP